ncbi:hypothetical protein EDB87DRAFT_1829702 [Lactarius vividus]|nr:hypothetical protein EDB87DRAFT_1829702 [Lactarius vividus]
MAATLGYFPVNTPGSHDTGPLSHDYYKRAVYRGAPRCFEVDSLTPTKFGGSYCYGLRISPVHGDATSSRTGATVGGYNIWRRWEDCLWFQDMLELRYGVISREKRQRLQAGKGVKKNGIYIHDRAASFESLPPGPDPKSVAMDVHQYLPKLTKRGVLFRQTQHTINQRQNEFVALIKAFFEEDVPSLVQELRQDRIIRDFFGYWRRDYDLACKEKGKRPKTASDAAETTTIFSSMFSQSSLSLSLPSPSSLSPTSLSPPTQVHRSPSISRWRPRAAESMISLPDTESAFSRLSRIIPRRNPSSAPARVGSTFRDDGPSEDEQPSHQRTTVASSSNSSSSSSSMAPSSTNTTSSRLRSKSQGAKTSSSTRAESFNVSSDFPLFLSTSTRDLLPSPRSPHSPTYATPGLRTLPEDSELGSPISSLPPPTPRNRKDANTDRAFRNCIVWNDTDEASSSEGDVLDRELRVSGGSVLKEAVTKYTSSSSLPSSIALSNFSPQSHRSSWRTSSELAWPASPSSTGSPLDPEFPHWVGSESVSKPVCSVPLIPTADGNHSLHGRRPRSISQPQPLDLPVPAEVGDCGWSDLGEDFIDAYFGGSESFSVSNEDKYPLDDGDVDLPLDVGEDPADVAALFHDHHHGAYVDEPVDLYTLPLATAYAAQQPQSPMAVTPTLLGVPPGSQMVTVKAVLDNTIVVFRARRDMALAELRQRVHDKFARTENIALHGAFALAYVLPTDSKSGRRVSSTSCDISRALPIWDEEDWQDALARCGSKITLRVYYPSQ